MRSSNSSQYHIHYCRLKYFTPCADLLKFIDYATWFCKNFGKSSQNKVLLKVTLNQMDSVGDVEWNFEKFLVSKDGTVIARFKSGVTPEDLKSVIEAALAA